MILFRTMNLERMFRRRKLMVAFDVRLETGFASIHLVKVPMATRRNWYPPGAHLKGPRASGP